ncbi:MAG TPA: transposase [Gemmataceae bacterium]|nr:transposase [Gemmataceae bacterium]
MTKRFPFRRVANYLAEYGKCFQRRDQIRWAAVYIHGLLSSLVRKNIENIAARADLPSAWGVLDANQALQNFIHQSPWDENLLWRRQRTRLAGRIGRDDGLFVIQEVPFVKQGRHSVGVHRQFSIALGQKINCQLAVAIHYVSTAGHAPLALRLYLPKNWIQSPARLDAGAVPNSFRRSIAKLQLALELLDQVRAESFPGRYVAAPGFTVPEEIRAALAERGYCIFETEMSDQEQGPANAGAISLRKYLHQAKYDLEWMRNRLGLDHFEGRSWRGFHHHACLVALAFAYKKVG